MPATRSFREFLHRGARYRIHAGHYAAVTGEIVRQRRLLETYVGEHPAFRTALVPIDLLPHAPEIAAQMAAAAEAAGVGPMAGVAGAMAQHGAAAALAAGDREVIVDNGGDVYLVAERPVRVGIYAGPNALGGHLAFSVCPEDTPIALCSSSGRMGHSQSLGDCDLATVASANAALADAAATRAANLVRTEADVDPALEIIAAIPGVDGVLLVKGDRIGLVGCLPELIRRPDS